MKRPVRQLSLLLSVVFLALVSCSKWGLLPSRPTDNGALNLIDRSANLVAVDGRWDFYPENLLYPVDFDQQSVGRALEAAPTAAGSVRRTRSYGTYRLSIQTAGTSGYYGILIPHVASAAALWVDGRKVGTSGRVGSSFREEVPSSAGISAFFHQSSDRVNLVLQVSDFHPVAAGEVPGPVLYGTAHAITEYEATVRGLIIGLVAILALMCILFLLDSLPGRRTRGNAQSLIVAVICLVGAVRGLAVPGLPGLFVTSPLIAGLPLTDEQGFGAFTFFALFIGYFLSLLPTSPGRVGRIGVRVLLILAAIVSVGFSFVHLPFYPSVGTGGFFLLAFAALIVLSLFSHPNPERDRLRPSALSATASIVLLLASANDVLTYAGVLSVGYFAPLSILVYAALHWLGARRSSPLSESTAGGRSMGAPVTVEILAEQVLRPLRGIVGLTESLLGGRMGDLEDEQIVSLSLIGATGLRLSNAVADFADRQRLQRQELELELSSVSIGPLVARVGRYLEPLTLVHHVDIVNDLPDDLPAVLGDRRRIEQIIYNLIICALHSRQDRLIVIAGRTADDMVEITVSTRARSEASQSQSPPAASPGLSAEFTELSRQVAAALVCAHGGTATGIDRPFAGATEEFEATFTLQRSLSPATPEESSPVQGMRFEPPPREVSDGTGRNREIIVAEEDLVTLQTMRNHLETQGYLVRTARDGTAALREVERGLPDLLIVDLSLAGVDGFEVCRRVRKGYSAAELPILMLLDLAQANTVVDGMSAGVTDFISRPVVADEFLNRVKSHIDLARLNALYGRFVPQELLRFLGRENVIDLKLGDQIQREMTILFVDIRAFTNLSEGMTPEENFKFINSFLSRFTPIIRENNGLIDNYIGDAILALYPGSPEDALRSAIRMIEYLEEYNRYRGNSGYRPIDIGIGIHTGTLIVGIIGDSERMQGTVISDAVNLASRVQDVTKLYGANIIISQDTFVRLDNPTDYNFRFLGKVRVKGKEHSVSLFEVFDGDKPERVALKNRTKQDFEEAILLFSKRQFPEASELFRKVVTRNPEDHGAAIFLDRCSYFQNREKANWLLK